MIRKEKGGVEWLEFEQLQPFPHVRHGVFTKAAGDCKGSHDARQKALSSLGINKARYCQNTHKDGVAIVDATTQEVVGVYDGSITQMSDVGLAMLHADCQAALFFDPVTNTIANVHSGWRGSVLNIYAKTIQKLQTLGVNPRDLIVSISPSLGPRSAEFLHYKEELPTSFLPFKKGECHFDFWEISRHQLTTLGVRDEAIECAGICTFEESQDFYSYRREKDRERNMTVIALIS